MKKKYSIYHKNINFLLTPSIKKQPMGRSGTLNLQDLH